MATSIELAHHRHGSRLDSSVRADGRSDMKRHTWLMIAAMVVTLLIGAVDGNAGVVTTCAGLGAGATLNGSTCEISAQISSSVCPLDFSLPAGQGLLIKTGGSIQCDDFSPASSIKITITN